jgi:hypothetical protein
MFDSDVDLTNTGASNCSKAAWLAYIGERSVDDNPGAITPDKPPYTGQIRWGGGVDFDYGTYSNAPGTTSQSVNKAIFRTTASGNVIRGVEFPVGTGSGFGGGTGTCSPYLLDTPLIWIQSAGGVRGQVCPSGSGSGDVPPAAGIYLNNIRGAEIGEDGDCEQNTMNTTEANVPTTTTEITALSATHACEEMFHIQATISEP